MASKNRFIGEPSAVENFTRRARMEPGLSSIRVPGMTRKFRCVRPTGRAAAEVALFEA
jgi:hypothetical protein